MANECTPLFRPGKDVTVVPTTAITGKTFVGVSANRDANGMIKAAPAAAAACAFGVASRNAAIGVPVTVIRGGIVPVTAGGAIAAGAEVEVGASGRAVTLASGKPVGYAVDAGTSGNDVLIALY